ncbi:hypothetical protein [Bradyrhizobium arachidis]|uniref:hypothetical protein n=1 Tax=Bradyrhizobium arachidis TaxID=858423 RepID=UPI0021622428|nr:hypothetical protein [Bradyrhizobium arachidis]UVO32582.1 curlin [Bradyrhizobium arachidis]
MALAALAGAMGMSSTAWSESLTTFSFRNSLLSAEIIVTYGRNAAPVAVQQTSQTNMLSIFQLGGTSSGGTAVVQTGERNNASVYQTGEVTTANVLQIGDTNGSRILQVGDMNSAFLTQFGRFNRSTIFQFGR